MNAPAGDAGFRHVFESIAVAVADAQARLDTLAPGRPVQYTIPRAETDIRFRVRIDSSRRVQLIFRLEGRGSHTTNRLCFALLATPDRPLPASQPPHVEIALPPYLLPVEQEREIGEQTEQFARGPAGPPPGEDTGLVCFRLTQPVRYFVARVDSDHKKDKIHTFYPDVPQRDSYRRNEEKKTRLYSPFGELFEALREAQRDPRFVPYVYVPATDLAWGWDRFDDILVDLWSSYRDAMQLLAARQPAGDQPVFFKIDDIRALFFYSEWTCREPDRLVDNSFDAEDDWIHNQVVLRHDPALSATRIELQHAEFVIAGDARRKLLEMIADADASEKIARECRKLAPVEVRDFEQAPLNALILLSYDRRPPDKGFLALWPTVTGDFMFTFDSDGQALKGTPKARAFIPLDAPESFSIDDDAYEEIHRFFRAVRLWRTRRARTSD